MVTLAFTEVVYGVLSLQVQANYMHTYTLRYILQKRFAYLSKSRIRPETYTIVLKGGGWIFLCQCDASASQRNGFPSISLFLPISYFICIRICPNMNRMLFYCTAGVGNL